MKLRETRADELRKGDVIHFPNGLIRTVSKAKAVSPMFAEVVFNDGSSISPLPGLILSVEV